jgi:hypothetical protein
MHHIHFAAFRHRDAALGHAVYLFYPRPVPAEVVENVPSVFVAMAVIVAAAPPALVVSLQVSELLLL